MAAVARETEGMRAGMAAGRPCALPPAGRLTSAFLRPTAFRGATAGVKFLAGLVWTVRFRPARLISPSPWPSSAPTAASSSPR